MPAAGFLSGRWIVDLDGAAGGGGDREAYRMTSPRAGDGLRVAAPGPVDVLSSSRFWIGSATRSADAAPRIRGCRCRGPATQRSVG
jgi:hypothetical protein